MVYGTLCRESCIMLWVYGMCATVSMCEIDSLSRGQSSAKRRLVLSDTGVVVLLLQLSSLSDPSASSMLPSSHMIGGVLLPAAPNVQPIHPRICCVSLSLLSCIQP